MFDRKQSLPVPVRFETTKQLNGFSSAETKSVARVLTSRALRNVFADHRVDCTLRDGGERVRCVRVLQSHVCARARVMSAQGEEGGSEYFRSRLRHLRDALFFSRAVTSDGVWQMRSAGDSEPIV